MPTAPHWGVKNWPDNCDPRDTCFMPRGWLDPTLPPWHWFVQAVGSTLLWDPLNDGVVFENFAASELSAEWFKDIQVAIPVVASLRASNSEPDVPRPPEDTVGFTLRFVVTAPDVEQIWRQDWRRFNSEARTQWIVNIDQIAGDGSAGVIGQPVILTPLHHAHSLPISSGPSDTVPPLI